MSDHKGSEGRIRCNEAAKTELAIANWLESQSSTVQVEHLATKIRNGAWRATPSKRRPL